MSAKHARPTRAQARAGAYARQPVAWIAPEHRGAPARPYARGPQRPGRGRAQRLGRMARGMLASAALLAGVSIVGVLAGTDTFALWSDAAPMDSGVLVSGSTGLAVTPASLTASNLLPGEVDTISFTITNGGGTALDVTPTVATTFTDYELRVLLIGTSMSCPDLSGYPAVGTTANAAIPVARIEAGGSRQVCAAITALATVQPQESAAFTLELDGAQAQ